MQAFYKDIGLIKCLAPNEAHYKMQKPSASPSEMPGRNKKSLLYNAKQHFLDVFGLCKNVHIICQEECGLQTQSDINSSLFIS